ncbi:citrate synthase-like protein [Mycena sp. CBHHK59/15]|nr:citrate synthase-like protein [Mycena sp. CBHHK59/15]
MSRAEPKTRDGSIPTIFAAVAARIPSRLELAAKLMGDYHDAPIHQVTVANVMSGMRGLPSMLWEISETSSTGVKYHGKTLQELQSILPKWPGSTQFSPEAMLWFLYSARAPTQAELQAFAADLCSRADIPPAAQRFCDGLAADMPAVTQLIMVLAFCSRYSKLGAAISSGVAKAEHWRYALDDALDAQVRFPMIVARLHANVYKTGAREAVLSPTSDLAHNFARRMGKEDDTDFVEFMRLSWSIHMDHGTNVSAHTMRLTSSAWTDTYLTLSAGTIAAIGPLHVKAITDSVQYNLALSTALGPDASDDAIVAHVSVLLAQRKIIPGYGHALLRVVDPRLALVGRFLDTHPARNPATAAFLALIRRSHTVVPELLRARVPRMQNLHANVDALSGCVLHAYGVPLDFLMPVMGSGRAMGFLVQHVWDKALGLPLERPLSVTMDEMLVKVGPKIKSRL